LTCTGGRPISLLLDSLVRPNADTGSPERSKLRWIYCPSRAISHMVVAQTSFGGSWNEHDDDMISISVNSFLDLPVFSVADWLGGSKLDRRLPAVAYRRYLSDYTDVLHIRQNIVCDFDVTHIKVDGELEEDRAAYNVRALKKMLLLTTTTKLSRQKVIVVGDGMSAADAVLHCLSAGIPVLHIIRRSDKHLRHIQLSRLSASLYPEYARVFSLMLGRCDDPCYTKITSAAVKWLNKGMAYIETPLTSFTEPFRVLCICIGKQSDLKMLTEEYTFQDYFCSEDPTLFRVGSLAGDHFVRYIVGKIL
uniref:Pyr_redox_2 domain-containing protein n=1 Tax=Gongylonema pulchrum TaxID=637853 RepID=A0A183CYK4_9BILA